jgi:hypothetical protein
MTHDRLRIDLDTRDRATPIFNQLAEEFTQLYADTVLARKVEADINGRNEEENTSEPAKAVNELDDAGRAPGEGSLLDE